MSDSDREALLARRRREGMSDHTGFTSGGWQVPMAVGAVTTMERPLKAGEWAEYPAGLVLSYSSRAAEEILKQEASLKAIEESIKKLETFSFVFTLSIPMVFEELK